MRWPKCEHNLNIASCERVVNVRACASVVVITVGGVCIKLWSKKTRAM